MLVLFLRQFPFCRSLKVSGLRVAVCIPTFHNAARLFSFPDYHLIICSGIRFFSLSVAKLKEREVRQWKFTFPNAALFFHKLPSAS